MPTQRQGRRSTKFWNLGLRPKFGQKLQRALRRQISLVLAASLLFMPPAVAEEQQVQNIDACSYDFRDERTSQIRVICDEAKAAKKAHQAQLFSGILHASIAAMCMSTCIWPWSQYACPLGSIGGAIIDAGVTASLTKDYAAATTSLVATGGMGALQLSMIPAAPAAGAAAGGGAAGAGAGAAVNPGPMSPGMKGGGRFTGNEFNESGELAGEGGAKAGEEAGEQAGQSTTQKVMCWVSTLLEVAQTAVKFSGAKESKDLEKERYNEARRIALTKKYVPNLNDKAPPVVAAQAPGGPSNAGGTTDSTETASSGVRDCSGTTTTGELVSCARANDPTLPAFLEDPKFQSEFKKMSGQELGQFVRNMPEGASASQIMGAALANTGAGADVAKVNEKYENYFKDYQRQRALAAYGGGGGGAGGGGGKGGKDMGQQMADIMGDLMKKMTGEGEGGQAANPNVSMMKFGFAGKHPDQLVQDRSVSLFDRVYYRYTQAAARVESWGWQSPYNRAIASQPLRPAPAATASRPGAVQSTRPAAPRRY